MKQISGHWNTQDKNEAGPSIMRIQTRRNQEARRQPCLELMQSTFSLSEPWHI